MESALLNQVFDLTKEVATLNNELDKLKMNVMQTLQKNQAADQRIKALEDKLAMMEAANASDSSS